MRLARRALILSVLCTLAARPAAGQPGIGTCVMGESRAASGGTVGLYSLGQTTYQWIDPAGCGFCLASEGAIVIRTVELEVFALAAPEPTAIPAIVSVIGWSGSADCPVPDESVVILPPQEVTFLVPASTLEYRLDVRVPIASSPQLLTPAFLKVDLPRHTVVDPHVAIGEVVSLTCPTCRQYLTAAHHDYAVMADVCAAPVRYPYAVRARGDCVSVTATRTRTWGQLKSFYR